VAEWLEFEDSLVKESILNTGLWAIPRSNLNTEENANLFRQEQCNVVGILSLVDHYSPVWLGMALALFQQTTSWMNGINRPWCDTTFLCDRNRTVAHSKIYSIIMYIWICMCLCTLHVHLILHWAIQYICIYTHNMLWIHVNTCKPHTSKDISWLLRHRWGKSSQTSRFGRMPPVDLKAGSILQR